MEFDALVGRNGILRPSGEIRQALQAVKGRRVQVCLEVRPLPAHLRTPGMEEEIERIAALQMESRGQVMRVLLSEGKLRKSRRFVKALRREAGR